MRLHVITCLALAGCAVPASQSDAALDPDSGFDAGVPQVSSCRTTDGGLAQLGMNDVSMLLPIDAGSLVPSSTLLPRPLYDHLVLDERGAPLVIDVFSMLQIVAVRFDLCDRSGAGACTAGSDAVLRLVLQPIEQGQARDTAFHAFYRVPAAEVPTLLDVLDALSDRTSGPLGVRWLGATQQAALASELRARCTHDRLLRLTFFAQPDFLAQVRWVFRGVELADGGFTDVPISGVSDGGRQHVFFGFEGFEVIPKVDAPEGFSTLVSSSRFTQASDAGRAQALAAFAEIDDPTAHGFGSLQCAACHVTTPLQPLRPGAENRYTSTWDLSLDGGASRGMTRSLRAFGWFHREPMISQRVVNETALVLDELAACPR